MERRAIFLLLLFFAVRGKKVEERERRKGS